MRKVNAILGPILILLLLIHGISGAFQLASLIPGGSMVRQLASRVMLVLVACHGVIGIILTIQTLLALRRSGRSYFRQNKTFWLSRISGAALLLFILYHVFLFTETSGEVFRLESFGWLQLIAHILLALSLAIHLAVNIKPLFISLGIENRRYVRDIMIILSILMLVCAAGFVVYYLRWNVLWRYGR